MHRYILTQKAASTNRTKAPSAPIVAVKKVHIPEGVKWAQMTHEQREYKKAVHAAAKAANNNVATTTNSSKRNIGKVASSSDDESSSGSSGSSQNEEPPLKKSAAVTNKKEGVHKSKEQTNPVTIAPKVNTNTASPLFNGKTWNQLTPAEKEEKKKLDAARNHSIAKEMVTKDLHLQQQRKEKVVDSDGDSDSVSVSSDDIDNRSNGDDKSQSKATIAKAKSTALAVNIESSQEMAEKVLIPAVISAKASAETKEPDSSDSSSDDGDDDDDDDDDDNDDKGQGRLSFGQSALKSLLHKGNPIAKSPSHYLPKEKTKPLASSSANVTFNASSSVKPKMKTAGSTSATSVLPASPLFNGKTWNQLTPAEKEEKKKLDAARNHSIAKEMVTKDLHLQQQRKEKVVDSDGDSDSVSVSSDDIDNRSIDITERFEASKMSQ